MTNQHFLDEKPCPRCNTQYTIEGIGDGTPRAFRWRCIGSGCPMEFRYPVSGEVGAITGLRAGSTDRVRVPFWSEP